MALLTAVIAGVAALLGALIGTGGSFFVQKMQMTNEQSREANQRLLDACASVMVVANEIYIRSGTLAWDTNHADDTERKTILTEFQKDTDLLFENASKVDLATSSSSVLSSQGAIIANTNQIKGNLFTAVTKNTGIPYGQIVPARDSLFRSRNSFTSACRNSVKD